MLYDNIRCLSDIFHHFLMDHPAFFHEGETWQSEAKTGPVQNVVQERELSLRQCLERWLDTHTKLTDPTQRAILLLFADAYETTEALQEFHFVASCCDPMTSPFPTIR